MWIGHLETCALQRHDERRRFAAELIDAATVEGSDGSESSTERDRRNAPAVESRKSRRHGPAGRSRGSVCVFVCDQPAHSLVRDASDAANPDKKMSGSKLRPTGARITNFLRYAGQITLPAVAAASEGVSTFVVTGAAIGDHVVFNISDALAADIGITGVRVNVANSIGVTFRNSHAANTLAARLTHALFW
jgi:hypothetical protein